MLENKVAIKRHWSEDLPHGACDPAVKWCKTQPSLNVAWEKCGNGAWMIWLLRRKIKGNKKKLQLLLADIAESVFDLVHDDHKLAAAWAISAARRGNTEECDAAYTVAYAAADAAAYAAAYVAAYVAADTDTDADAAYVAADTDTDADAAYAAAADAGSVQRKINADIVRDYFPNPPRLEK